MERYIAVDSGKYATKVAMYNPDTKTTKKFNFRTKIGSGNFADDALEGNTIIAEINGTTYKIGNGAQQKAELETTKMSEIHQACTLAAIAMCVSTTECDNVHVAIGIPMTEYCVVEKRMEYKEYILPDGEITISIKTKSEKPKEMRKFKIVSKSVYPESAGVLYLDIARYAENTAAVIDIGNLNVNCSYWQNLELDQEYSITDELGGNIMVTGLSQELSAAFSRCSEDFVMKVLRQPIENRKLVPNTPNKDIEAKSAAMIHDYLVAHVKEIKRKLDAKHWSLDFMELAFIGGTTKLLRNEIHELFGDTVYIPENPEFANVEGFLRRLCAKHLGILIPIAQDAKDVLNPTEKMPEEKKKKAV